MILNFINAIEIVAKKRTLILSKKNHGDAEK